MSKVKSLPGQRMSASLPPDRIPWENSDAIPRNGHRRAAPQPRALRALELALNIRAAGYNVYLSGEANLGRTYMLKEFLAPRDLRQEAFGDSGSFPVRADRTHQTDGQDGGETGIQS